MKKNPPDNVIGLADAAKGRRRKNARGDGGGEQPNKGPVIKIRRGKLPEVLDQAEEALAQHDGNLFDLAGRLVRITTAAVERSDPDLKRDPGAILLRDVTPAHLVDRLARIAHFKKFDQRAGVYVAADVPRIVAEALLARAGEWNRIPKLRGFVEGPTLRADGSVLDRPGYDEASQLFFVGDDIPGYWRPGESRTAAQDARDRLEEMFSDLPFEDETDRAGAIAAMLTAIFRRVLPAAPLVGVTAPAPGTGKSLLADAISIIATGRRAAVMALGKDEAEQDKRLFGALLAGDVVVVVDNIERPVYGDVLCQALTQPSLKVRPLGSSTLVSAPTNTTFLATGNNLDVRGDLRRRVMLVRLDARTERPELRRFEYDLLERVAERRGAIVRDALTLTRSYLAAGAPDQGLPEFGGFALWSRFCRAPLVWIGFRDPLLASEGLREQDPDLAAQAQLFEAWYALCADEAHSAGNLIMMSEQSGELPAALRAALDIVCAERISARRFGNWLRRHRGRIIGNKRLDNGEPDSDRKIARWRLVRVG